MTYAAWMTYAVWVYSGVAVVVSAALTRALHRPSPVIWCPRCGFRSNTRKYDLCGLCWDILNDHGPEPPPHPDFRLRSVKAQIMDHTNYGATR